MVSDAAILLDDLGKRFGEIVAVDGVSLEVPAGTVLGLLGPNGAGKTTIVRVLTTILRPDRGRATVLGYDVATQPGAVRTSIGLAGQRRGHRRQGGRLPGLVAGHRGRVRTAGRAPVPPGRIEPQPLHRQFSAKPTKLSGA